MSDASDGGDVASADDRRRLAVLALCALALLVAAFAFPGTLGAPSDPVDGPGGPDENTTSTPHDTDGPGGGANGTDGTWAENVTGGEGAGGEGGDGEGGDRIEIAPGNGSVVDGAVSREDAERVYAPGCLVLLGAEPTPGARIPVYVLRDGDLVSGVRVAFNGDSIGRTDDTGRVVGRVPYRKELTVSADVAGVEDCQVETPESLRRGGRETSGFGRLAGSGSLAASTLGTTVGSAGQTDPTGTVTVDGTVVVGVRGEAYPGETVTLVAAIDGVSMRHATVRVDGDRVGETGVDGRLALPIPEDAGDELRVTVERGDFSGTGTIDVATLEITLRSETVITVPGQDVSAEVTVDGENVTGATVATADGGVGTTDTWGQVALSMPADPTTTVTARHRGLTAATAVWPLYLPLVLGVVVAVGAIAGTARRYGRRRGAQVAAGVGAVTVAYAAYRIDGRRGLLVAVVAMALVGMAVWLRTNRRRVAAGADEAGDTLGAFVEWLAATALLAVGGIERLFARGRALGARFLAWLSDAPRSVGGIVAALAAGWLALLASVPDRLRAALVWLARSPFALIAAIRQSGEHDDAEDESPTDEDRPTATVAVGNDDGDPESISLREAWRRFARRVARDWQRRTPGEVARAALDQGLPRESVVELTTVFRDVEYGERRPSAERIERAREAFRAIEADHDVDGEAGD